MSCLSISIPVQNSFSDLHRDFSQQMDNLVNGVSSTKENLATLEKKVKTYLQSQILLLNYNLIRKICFVNDEMSQLLI